MHCKSCGNPVAENAAGCINCGMDPKKDNKFCPGCGVNTNSNQIICVKCGISLTASKTKASSPYKPMDPLAIKKGLVAGLAVFAFFSCFGTWFAYGSSSGLGGYLSSALGFSYSLFSLSTPSSQAHTILIAPLLFLLPFCLIGVVLGEYLPQLNKFKKVFLFVSLGLVIYALIGLYQCTQPVEVVANNSFDYNSGYNYYGSNPYSSGIWNNIKSKAQAMAGGSIGTGFYCTFIFSLAMVGVSLLYNPKK